MPSPTPAQAVAISCAAGAVAGVSVPRSARRSSRARLAVGVLHQPACRHLHRRRRAHTLHELSDPGTQVPSLVGVVLIAAAGGLVLSSVLGTEEYAWLSARSLGLFVTELLMLVVF